MFHSSEMVSGLGDAAFKFHFILFSLLALYDRHSCAYIWIVIGHKCKFDVLDRIFITRSFQKILIVP